MKNRMLFTLAAALLLCMMLTPAALADTQTDAVGEWYLAGGYVKDSYATAEQLGAFMHLQLNADGTAANIRQDGTQMDGTWRAEDAQIIITFAGSDGIFAMENGALTTTFGDGSHMRFTHTVAGTYVPGNVLPVTDVMNFNGTWDVQWMLTNGAYQSIEYLRYNYGLDSFSVVLENGTLKTDTADYGLVFSEGMLYFSAAGEVQLLIALQDDGMLLYADRANNVAYYCTKQE